MDDRRDRDGRDRVVRALRELGVADDAPIGVACSGGGDSIALVHILADRRDVTVLHVDHHLRDDSWRDAEFVEETARALRLPYAVENVLIDLTPDGVEAAARAARYEALEDMARAQGLRYVLTAHTMDDQAETVLLRLLRGGSLEGIAPARGIVRRPLLHVRGAELRRWLMSRNIEWREDPSNADTGYDRNWVRHVLLPQLQERRSGVAKVLARTATRTRTDDDVLDALALDVVARAGSDDVGLLVRAFDALAPAVAVRVIRHACRELGADPSENDVDAVRTIARHVRCGGLDVWRLDDGLAFVRSPMPVPDAIRLPPYGEITIDPWGLRLRIDGAPHDGLQIRSRRPGDRVPTRAGHRKVQDVLVDAKVPRPLRALVPILADDAGPLAVIGGRDHMRLRRLQSDAAGAAAVAAEPFNQSWSRELAWIR